MAPKTEVSSESEAEAKAKTEETSKEGETEHGTKGEHEAKKDDGVEEKSKQERKPSGTKEEKPGVNTKTQNQDPDPLDAVCELMQSGKLEQSLKELRKMLKTKPGDSILLHNLGVVCTELGQWDAAENAFTEAYEAQSEAKAFNDDTMFGLATVLTEQGGMGKLLQGEALFRDCLERAIAKEERGILATWRNFTSLGENLGQQKRWKDASEAYEQALLMAEQMFGATHEKAIMQRAMLARAQRLARMQKWIRGALWAATAAVPVFCAWMWKYFEAPSFLELFQLTSIISNNSSVESATAEGIQSPLG